MIDASIDISSTSHVVVFGTFVEEGLFVSVFLDLFEVPNGKKMPVKFLGFNKEC